MHSVLREASNSFGSRAILGALVLVLGFSFGCGVRGPAYRRPDVPMTPEFRHPTPAGPAIADLPWWDVFQDPALSGHIRSALRLNQDIARAVARVEEARANLGFVRADQFPQIGSSVTASRQRISAGALGGANTSGAATNPGGAVGSSGTTFSNFRLGPDLSYEVDLFGRLAKATRAARADLLANELARRAVGIALVSQVAQAYMELIELDNRLAILHSTLVARQAALKLVRDRSGLGMGSDVELLQSEREVETAAVDIPSVERQIAQKENELSELLGRPPGIIARGSPLLAQPMPPAVPAGLPVQLLERRPDVRQAEMALTAQHLRVDIARALRYPRLAITGFAGFQSRELSSILGNGNFAWNLASNLTAPLFTFGRNTRRIDVEKAREKQLIASYRAVILRALREVSDALIAVSKFAEELDHVQRRLALSRRAYDLSQLRYQSGITTYLEVLDTQRELLLSELQASTTRRNRLVAVVQLYRALGGGWSDLPPELQARPVAQVRAVTTTTSTMRSVTTTEADGPESD